MRKAILRNNRTCILADQGDEGVLAFIERYATVTQTVKKYTAWAKQPIIQDEDVPLYEYHWDSGKMRYEFPAGLWNVIPDITKNAFEIEDLRTNKYPVKLDRRNDWNYVKTILQPESGFDLRDDQIVSVMKILNCRRGIHESSTGSGKTEIFSACIKILLEKYPDMKIMVIEPTDILVKNTCKRLQKYGIDAVPYKKTRGEIKNSVILSHPTVLLNDLAKDPDLLSCIDGVFWDECHHVKADTWMKLNAGVREAEYAIGVSALALEASHKFETDIKNLSLDEIQIIGATGKLINYVPAGYYISRGILAVPVIIQMKVANELCDKKESDWTILRSEVIESVERSYIISDDVEVFDRYGRKSLILVGSKSQANLIAKCLSERHGLAGKIGFAYGQSTCQIIDTQKYAETIGIASKMMQESDSIDESMKEYIKNNPQMAVSDEEFALCIQKTKKNTVDLFDEGKLSILIATTVLDEGVDVSMLDTVFLARGGKKDRRIIQQVGRSLRKSKTGKFAYVIDYVETCNGVLTKHGYDRMAVYKDELQTPEDRIFRRVEPGQLESIFLRLEGIQPISK